MSNQPAKKFRLGYLSATLWANKNGDSTFYTIDLQRTYKDGEVLKNTNSLNHADLLNGARLLQRAEAWISDQ